MPSWTSVEQQSSWPRKWSYLIAVLCGTMYGIGLRYCFGLLGRRANISWEMTIAFLGVGSAAIGYVTIQQANRRVVTAVHEWIFAPWVPAIGACLLAVLFHLEGFVCLLFAIPAAVVGASFGGVLAGIIGRTTSERRTTTLTCVALAPLLFAFIETRLTAPTQTRTVSSAILIHASSQSIWQNIERVPTISPAELRPNWTLHIGFPRPIEATLSYEGVGGIRHATFERGLLFIETVTAWEPDQRLAFTIKADTEHIPPTTLDEHVTIGGRYFDVLDGEYRLEPVADGNILLHLTSHQRLTTDFNGYAGLWSDAVMQALQTSILQVIQHRCEHA